MDSQTVRRNNAYCIFFNFGMLDIMILLVFCTAVGCSNHKEYGDIKRRDFPNPYAESFYGKNLKEVIGYHKKSLNDTVVTLSFDRDGNIIRKKAVLELKKWAYDSLRFVVRELSEADVYFNYVITYTRPENSKVVQHWNLINGIGWKYDKSQLSPVDTFSVKFSLDENGYILTAKDLRQNTLSVFEYDSNKNLTRQATKGIDDGKLIEETIYEYRNEKLASMRHIWDGKLRYEHFFSLEGLIDSTLRDGGDVLVYKFGYYEE